MQPRLDPVGKVEEMYSEGTHEVSYLTFMNIFNDLLQDPMAVVPREPAEELVGKFRAACMALSMGVADTEGRAAERLEEFRAKVLPVWRESMTKEEFRKFEDIMRGGGLRRRRAQQRAAVQSGPVAANEKSSALLKRLRLIDVAGGEDADEAVPEQPPQAPTAPAQPAAQEAAAPAPPPPPAGPEVPTFEGMSALCRAISQGELEPREAPGGGVTFARYRLGPHKVAVKLALVDPQTYAVLTIDIGTTTVPGGLEAIDVMAAAMGYMKMTSGAYMRREADGVHTLKAGTAKVSLASAGPREESPRSLAARLTRLHWDLGELLERMDV